MSDTPFIGPSYALTSRPASVQRTVNMMPIPLEPGNERSGWVFKDVPGLVQVTVNEGVSDPFFPLVFWLLPGSVDFQDYGSLAKGNASVFGEVVSNAHLLFTPPKKTIACGGQPNQRAEVFSSPIPDVFCIEGFYFSTLPSGQGALFSNRNGSAFGFMAYANSSNILQFSITSGGTTVANPSGSFTPSVWNYFALDRDALGSVRLFMGVAGGTATQQGPTIVAGLSKPLDGGTHWCCGADPSDLGSINCFNGSISNLRVTLASRYTASFPVPVAPFPTH